ncbi:pyrimidine reductase family protein [Actinoplanes sp. NPDC049599]|uniref:pyrimidine reductase family protein n=1 Tax=Actinoplanes sp. NPDC049599 TaxID=3363903 RepID=UPI0037A9A632
MIEARDADLVERYPRRSQPVLRVNFVASVDGAVTVDGKSGGLGGPGDKLIFDSLRMVCDALVVAAGTVRSENYDALRLTAPARAWRRAHGLPEFPLMVIVSGSLDLDPEQLVFADAPIRPLVVTHAAAPAGRRAALAGVAEIITVGDTTVDLAAAVRALHDRGATQLLCEGGPRLFGALIAADLVDELCLTLSPRLVGGSAGRIATGPDGPPREMSLAGLLADGDMLFLRYVRSR